MQEAKKEGFGENYCGSENGGGSLGRAVFDVVGEID